MAIGENHRRGISATLALLDEKLCECETWAQGREVRSALYVERNTLSPQQKQQLLAFVAEARHILADLRDVLGLQRYSSDVAAKIAAECSGLWAHLVELQGKHLKRYGEPPPGLTRYLDPKIAELIEIVRNIADAVQPWAEQDGEG